MTHAEYTSMPDSKITVYQPDDQGARALAVTRPGALDQNPAAVYIAGLKSPASRRTMIHALNTVAGVLGVQPVYTERQDQRSSDPAKVVQEEITYLFVNWSALRYQHTMAIRAQLTERYTAAGTNKILSALRQVLKRAWRLNQMTGEEYYRARDVENVGGETLLAGRDLSNGEIGALLRVCVDDPSTAGARDGAIIAVMYQTGIRRASVVKLNLADYDRDTGKLKVLGAKRNKDYITWVSDPGAQAALADWLELRGEDAGPLFYPVSQTGEILRTSGEDEDGKPIPWRLTTQAIYNMLAKRGEEAKLTHFSPHDFRRSLAGDLLDAGADIVTVQKILGHSNVNTTARYDRRPEEVKRKAASLVHVPYPGRTQKRLPNA